ncbi:ABC transporter ATP-binding protein [Hyphomicrobium sp.]|uniref:ABC transporter ATP-binding protein n=1 Tax=Hyphomicrobium sp. TaxID=82 RepID=UPI003F6FFE5D
MTNSFTLPGSEDDVILEVSDVRKYYGGIHALDGLSLSVKRGEVHCVLGPNGAGKSTFFKTLIGTERPTSGRIIYNGSDITRFPAFQRVRAGLSVKFQNLRLFGELTVGQNLFTALRRNRRYDEIPEHTRALLTRIHLRGSEDRLMRHLSHGEQQRVAIAMSLASNPQIVLLDEPTAGLSVDETRLVEDIIHDVNQRGVTVVVIEHDMDFIRSLNGRVSVLHYGKLFAQGSFDEIADNDDVRRIYLGAA